MTITVLVLLNTGKTMNLFARALYIYMIDISIVSSRVFLIFVIMLKMIGGGGGGGGADFCQGGEIRIKMFVTWMHESRMTQCLEAEV